jgi:hypothetical protein
MAGGDLHVTEADAGVEHGGHERVAQHVWVHPRHPDSGGGGDVLEAAGLEDPQSEQTEKSDEREVVEVGRQARGGDEGTCPTRLDDYYYTAMN